MKEETRLVLLRAPQVAEMLGVSRSKIYTLLAQQKLPVVKIGRSVRVPRDALAAWIEKRTLGAE